MSFLANIVIEPDLCNLRCNYCWIGEAEIVSRKGSNLESRFVDKSRPSQNRSVETLIGDFSFLLNHIDATVLKISGGEVFLLPEILEVAKEYAHRFTRIQVLTNGTLMDSVDLEALDPSIFTFQVSIDGHSGRENRERFGRRSDFLTERVLKNISDLYSKNYLIEINSVLSPSNLFGFVEFAEKFYKTYPMVTIFPFPVRFSEDRFSLSSKRHLDELTRISNICGDLTGTLPPRPYFDALRQTVENGKEVSCFLPALVQSSDERGNLSLCPCGNIEDIGNIFDDDALIDCPHATDERVTAVMNWEHGKCRECFTHFDLVNLYMAGAVTSAELCSCGIFQDPRVYEALVSERRRVHSELADPVVLGA